MIRTLSLVKRSPDLDRSAFRDHYETRHAPLSLPLMEGLDRYVRYHVEEDLLDPVGFDVLTAFWFRDRESIDRLMGRLAGDEGEPIRTDELRFMDRPASRFFPVSERRLEPGEEGTEHVFVLLARPPDTSRFEFSKTLVRDDWPALAQRLDRRGLALLRDAFPMAGREPPWDAVLQVEAPSPSGLPQLVRWLEGLARGGRRVAAVRTRRFETELGSTGRDHAANG